MNILCSIESPTKLLVCLSFFRIGRNRTFFTLQFNNNKNNNNNNNNNNIIIIIIIIIII